ncbi:MAG: thermonuclease family protein [Candidatus Aenigmarchaeota archaeon]|nr:thermonuclease family protein [Candidatus Aenigmarchaeota archaeon]
MTSRLLLVVSALVILAIISGFTGYFIFTAEHDTTANVTKVIDGDTVEIGTGERVRLLGINAPETNEHYYKEAKEKLIRLVQGKDVVLKAGFQDKDLYGRLLRYIFVNGSFVNLEMVKGGYVTVYVIDPEEKYYLEFKKAESDARSKMLGLWNASSFGSCITLAELHYTGTEYAVFHNSCGYPIKMDKWEVKDEGTHIYVFGSFTLNTNSSVTLFIASGKDTSEKLYWNSKTTIWNNNGDTLFLRDDNGNLVLSYNYP